MQIMRVNRNTPEAVYLVVTNVDATSITLGYLANLCVAGNSFNGNNAVKAASGTAANLPAFIGVAAQNIASNEVGRVQCWGFAASVFLSHVGSSITINQGDPLVPGALAGGAFSLAPTYAASGFGYILASNVPPAISASAYVSGFVKCI